MIQLSHSLYLLSICWNQGQHCVVMALACCQMRYFQELKCHLDLRERASICWSIVRMFHDRYDSLSNSVTQIRKCLILCICFFLPNVFSYGRILWQFKNVTGTWVIVWKFSYQVSWCKDLSNFPTWTMLGFSTKLESSAVYVSCGR